MIKSEAPGGGAGWQEGTWGGSLPGRIKLVQSQTSPACETEVQSVFPMLLFQEAGAFFFFPLWFVILFRWMRAELYHEPTHWEFSLRLS